MSLNSSQITIWNIEQFWNSIYWSFKFYSMNCLSIFLMLYLYRGGPLHLACILNSPCMHLSLNHPALHVDIFLTYPFYTPVSHTSPSLPVHILFTPFSLWFFMLSHPPVRTHMSTLLASDTSCGLPTYVDVHFVLFGFWYPPNWTAPLWDCLSPLTWALKSKMGVGFQYSTLLSLLLTFCYGTLWFFTFNHPLGWMPTCSAKLICFSSDLTRMVKCLTLKNVITVLLNKKNTDTMETNEYIWRTNNYITVVKVNKNLRCEKIYLGTRNKTKN